MRFKFRLRVNVIGLLLIAGMLRLSYWQWQRHLGKQAFIHSLDQRLQEPVGDLAAAVSAQGTDWSNLEHRRLRVRGEYDFSHEMILRNRRLDEMPGVHVLTPLKIAGSDRYIIVDRGFIPLAQSEPESRKIYQKPTSADFVGLVKETVPPLMLAPQDPEAGPNLPWVDAWLRPDLAKIGKQLPYPILPVYLEIMQGENAGQAESKIVKASSGRDDLFFLPSRTTNLVAAADEKVDMRYPVPVFDTVIPPGRHLGYVFEWAGMALVTFLICVILQFRRPDIA